MRGSDIVDIGAAPLLVVGAISPAVLVAIKVAPSGGLPGTVPNFLGMKADRESVGVAVTVVISVFAGVVDALTTESSRIVPLLSSCQFGARLPR
jgi:hypothetical protein